MSERLTPVTASERIEAIDVVRGFALIGIFLMNVEFFNRPMSALEDGMPQGVHGIDWFAGWFVAYFVKGKFWTIFSLLFGMGFAVMLTRAERAERPFLGPYLRRIAALAVFGTLHYVLVWSGDILLSYALGAAGLLVVLYGRWKWLVGALVVMIGLGFLVHPVWQVAGSFAFIATLAIFMRNNRKLNFRIFRLPIFSLLQAISGLLATAAATICWVVPAVPVQPAIIVTAIAAFFLVGAVLSARYHDPVELRPLRLGASLYVLPALMIIAIGTVQYMSPVDASDTDRAARVAEHHDHEREEDRVMSSGTYREAVAFRAAELPQQAANESGFAVIAIGMFLIGAWFVRSGTMTKPREHLALFRKLALYGLPLGIGLGLAGSAIATGHRAGEHDGYQLAEGLSMLGSLPASLGYVGLVVVALYSNSAASKIRVLAPAGRMALTNYLTQSIVSTSIFYGYGAGQYGLARSWQIVYVAAVFTLQVAFSHWWLARFRYGPMEWLWRAITYRTIPDMRIRPLVPATANS